MNQGPSQSHRSITFVLRDVRGEKWCSLTAMGVKRIDVVAYNMNFTENFVLTGGHRHRKVIAQNDVHILIPPIEKPINIKRSLR